MEEMALRLDAAADDLAGMKADLSRHEPVFDQQGRGAQQLATTLRVAWAGQIELAGRLTIDVGGLAMSVRLAAGNYRATDGEAR